MADFKVGDFVVYPPHGAGTVVSKEQRDKSEYLSIRILHSKMTLMVPADIASEKGVRKIMAVSGRVLDVLGLNPRDGAAVGQWDFVDGDNQQWLLLPAPGNEFVVMSRMNGKVLDIAGGPAAIHNGAPLQMWSFLGGANQRFRLERVVP